MRLPHQLSINYASGSIGALVMCMVMWFFGAIGICETYSVDLTPKLTLDWLYPNIIYGGLWGLLLVLPWMEGSPLLRAICASFAPAFYKLFVIYPIMERQGIMGQDLGDLTPAFIVFYYLVWGITTGLWLRMISGGKPTKKSPR